MTSKVFVTADWHFNHRGLCRGTSHWTHVSQDQLRDFDSPTEMNEAIIDGINSVVGRKDLLWNLGDVIFGNTHKLPALRRKIACRDIRVILGNHDKNIKEHRINDSGKRVPNGELGECFSDVRSKYSIRHNDQKIYLLHEPMHTWPGINKGFMHLYGHCHGNLPDRGLRCMDVGVDTNNYKPWLLDDVIDILLAKQYDNCPDIPQDHHARSLSAKKGEDFPFPPDTFKIPLPLLWERQRNKVA